MAVRGPGPAPARETPPAMLRSQLLGLFPAQHPLPRASGAGLSPACGEALAGREDSGEAGSEVPGAASLTGRRLASGSGLTALASFHFLPLKLLVQFLAASLQMGPCPPCWSSAGDPAACRGWGSEQRPVYRKRSLALALNPLMGFFFLLIQCIRIGRDLALMSW